MRTISIARDFSATPGGRFNRDGPHSGEAFRSRFLEPIVDSGEVVVIDLDDVAGLPSSFLEEAFGGLVRAKRVSPAFVRDHLLIRTDEPDLLPYVHLINRYVSEAAKKASLAA
jgi:hypothetical protein